MEQLIGDSTQSVNPDNGDASPANTVTEKSAVDIITAAIEKEIGQPAAEPVKEVKQKSEDNVAQPEADAKSLFDDDVDQVDDAEEEQLEDIVEEIEDQKLFKVKVDGEEIEVPLEELLQSYSRQSSWTKKSQALADERKEVDTMKSQLSEQLKSVEPLAQQMQSALQKALDYADKSDPVLADWVKLGKDGQESLRKDNFSEYLRKKDAVENRIVELRQYEQQLSALKQQQMQKTLAEEQHRLLEAIPEFKDPKIAQKTIEQLVSKGQEYYNYSAEELGAVTDHRNFITLIDAIKWRNHVNKLKTANGKITKPAPSKVTKPGAVPVNARTDDMSRKQRDALTKARQTRNHNDSIDAIASLLQG